MSSQAPVALTLGEPAGIGPELAAMAWAKLEGRLPFFVLGDPAHLGHLGVPVVPIAAPAEAPRVLGRGLPVLAHPFPAPATPGRIDPANAPAVISAITRAVDLTLRGEAAALTTGPIHKKALIDGAGFAFAGHTEFLAHLAGIERVVMMLAGPGLRVVPTTIHIPLAEVPQTLDRALLSDTIRITDAALRREFGIEAPRIAVTGLNPHAGEGGAIGREEIEVIAPVLDALRAEGYGLTGPHSADTLFHAAARARYDAVVAMYHDQALIPLKTLAFDEGVNVTLGLPFVRTSPDHGTALDIAGTGRANPQSTIAALELAAELARNRATG
ncbi:MAG: 4-hydroxythreonine-4-phosphate dehydrogenase PdxA [Roseicyclus sp.]